MMIASSRARILSRSYLFLSSQLKNVLHKQKNHISRSSVPKKIGFIGLGNMGSRMSKNLIKKGYEVIVFDNNLESLSIMKNENCKISDDPIYLSKNVDCIITMLPSGLDVIDLYTGSVGIIKSMKPGTLVIDSSTTDPAESTYLGKCLSGVNVQFIDAPVSGGVNGAEKATLTFMVGGKNEIIDKAEPILMSMGSKLFRCGEVGAGQVAKLCNNMLLAISMTGLSEAANLAIRMGLDPNLIMTVINASSGRCWSSEVYSPVPGIMKNVPSDNDYKPGFASRIMLKDLHLARKMAKDCKTPTPLGENTTCLYEDLVKSPQASLDFSVIFKYLQTKCE